MTVLHVTFWLCVCDYLIPRGQIHFAIWCDLLGMLLFVLFCVVPLSLCVSCCLASELHESMPSELIYRDDSRGRELFFWGNICGS